MEKNSGVQLARRIAAGELPAQDAMAEACERIAASEPEIQAFVATLDRATALSHAAQARGPLAGLAVAVKDIFDTADLPTAYGSSIYAGYQPGSDAAIVSLIRRAGGTVIGKTVTCEFAYMAPTQTRNPADLRRTAGGSSSGSAAAVAAGMVPFAIGTQTGGSTIRPASFCGIAGYKPSYDLFPTPGMKYFSWSLDTVGLFAATVTDVAWFAEALIGRSLARSPLDMRQLVVGIPQAYPWEAPSASATQAVQQASTAIEAAGGKVRQIALPAWIGELYRAHAPLQEYEATQTLAFEFDRHRGSLSPMLGDFLQRAQRISVVQYDAARKLIDDAKMQMDSLFEGIDVLLTPSAPGEAPMGWTSTGDPAFNKVWTLLGTPCVSVPGLSGLEGCPMGVQVIAPPWQDQRCLAAAALVEAAIRTCRF
ncbi:amidase [Herbaspirillum lusitanum]|uniref:amidase n=1 Tax=Herbaspirillum lusitanum TaxID=213312 RepID=UPI0022373695|nr:amidase [Herbaspirillum lusitanum]MCW5300371.1 amidase [Herbaspirillum lusitanum]